MTTVDLAVITLSVVVGLANALTVTTLVDIEWYKTSEGRALMLLSLAMAGLMCLGILNLSLGTHYAARSALRLGVYTLLAVGNWMMTIFLLRIQSKRRS